MFSVRWLRPSSTFRVNIRPGGNFETNLSSNGIWRGWRCETVRHLRAVQPSMHGKFDFRRCCARNPRCSALRRIFSAIFIAMYTIKEAAQLLHISPSLLYRLCNSGQIDHVRYGLGRGTIRISAEAIQVFVRQSKVVTFLSPRESHRHFCQLDSLRLVSAWKQQGVLSPALQRD